MRIRHPHPDVSEASPALPGSAGQAPHAESDRRPGKPTWAYGTRFHSPDTQRRKITMIFLGPLAHVISGSADRREAAAKNK